MDAMDVKALKSRVRAAWHALKPVRRPDVAEIERELETVVDRFELERREQAHNRRQRSEASLLDR
jgi:hypothetical protein